MPGSAGRSATVAPLPPEPIQLPRNSESAGYTGWMKPRTLILRTAGTNCDTETAYAFEAAGAQTERVHINRFQREPSLLDRFQILAIPGGFSYGDDIAAGKILAARMMH